MPTNDEYWKERSERRILEAEKTADELLKDMKTLYLDTIDRINKEIEAFFGRYSTETGLSIEDVRKLLDTEELSKFRKEAQKYYDDIVKHAYDPTYKQRLKNELYQTTTKEGRKLYSLRKNVSRLDYLKMQIENALEVLYMKENEAFTSKLSSTYEDTYMRSVFDTQQATAVFQPFNSLNNSIIEKAVQQKWLGENYSDRIWSDKNKLLDTLNKTFLQDVAIGKSPKAIASDIKKATGVKYSNCERLARTEFNHIANQATYDSYSSTEGLKKYKYVATLDFRTSEICQNLSGKVFLVKEAEIGVNYPPMHANCIIGDMIAYSPDIEKLTKSSYSGNIFKFVTSKGRSFTVTPNHIMLTSRGWVRAKNIIKGDDIIYYSGWDKFLSSTTLNPTDYNSITTIEKLFTSFLKNGLMFASRMPATPENFKGDVVENSEISIINVDSFLGNKKDIPFGKLISDFSLIPTNISTKSNFSTFSSIFEFLYCIGLASDGIMSSGGISNILLNGAFTHHNSISFRKSSHYDTRLFQTSYNNSSRNFKCSSNTLNTFSRIIKSDNFFNIKNFSSIGISNNNIILSQNSSDWFTRSIKCLCDFCNTFSEFVSFDDIIDIQIQKFSGHVYDISSLSTVYLCNGFVSSNCRSTTIPYLEDLDYSKMEQIATLGGKSYFVPSDMNYKDWLNSLTEKEGKMYIAERKATQQYKSDVKQLNDYRKLVTQAKKQGNAELFEGFPTKIKDFQQLKYTQPEKWEIYKNNAKIVRND